MSAALHVRHAAATLAVSAAPQTQVCDGREAGRGNGEGGGGRFVENDTEPELFFHVSFHINLTLPLLHLVSR